MNYAYDILLNFQDVYYDFFEWNEEDEIVHVKKIAIFLISHSSYIEIKNYNIKVSKDFISNIYNKCEVFNHYRRSGLYGAFIISNGDEAMAIKFDKNGYLISRSSLIFDENDDISRAASNLDEVKFSYEIINNNTENIFLTRFERTNTKDNLDKLKSLFDKKDFDKINYLYLECFNSSCNDKKKVYHRLCEEIKSCGSACEKINSFFRILEQK